MHPQFPPFSQQIQIDHQQSTSRNVWDSEIITVCFHTHFSSCTQILWFISSISRPDANAKTQNLLILLATRSEVNRDTLNKGM